MNTNEVKKYFKKAKHQEQGITLVALVVTIIVLLILAGITIGMLTSDSGIIGKAKDVANTYRKAEAEENNAIKNMTEAIKKSSNRSTEEPAIEKSKPNAPALKTGMTPVKFVIDEKDTSKMKTVKTTSSDSEWYNYDEKKWANAQTEDGSLWVWIPRYAYRINKPASSDAEQKGTTEVVFLRGLTDTYIGEDGDVYDDVKRCKTETDKIDTTTGWTVHPAFTNESSINFRNGGWNSELYGIWVAKFEAAYATTSNVPSSKVNVSSGINYSQSTVWAPLEVMKTENSSATSEGLAKARNYVDGVYGSTKTSIKYPTFQGSSYSMNYINHNDAYLLSRRLTTDGNIYGLSSDTDSHLIKDSEWGSVSYISKSKYGLGSVNIAINNKNFTNNTNNVYAGTGYNDQEKAWNDISITTTGNSASTTGNIYGIYDVSGGTWERTASYINNSVGTSAVAGKTKSTKYETVYSSNETSSTNTDDQRSQSIMTPMIRFMEMQLEKHLPMVVEEPHGT